MSLINGIEQVEQICTNAEIAWVFFEIRREITLAQTKFPHWPVDLIHGDAIVSEEKGEATKALLDIAQGKSTEQEMINEYVQTAAMCVRQLVAIQRLRANQ